MAGSSWNDVLRGALVCLPQRRGDNTIRALGAWLFLARQFGWQAAGCKNKYLRKGNLADFSNCLKSIRKNEAFIPSIVEAFSVNPEIDTLVEYVMNDKQQLRFKIDKVEFENFINKEGHKVSCLYLFLSLYNFHCTLIRETSSDRSSISSCIWHVSRI